MSYYGAICSLRSHYKEILNFDTLPLMYYIFRYSPSYVLYICPFLSLDRHKSFRLTSTDLLVIIISDFNFGKFFASFVKIFHIFNVLVSIMLLFLDDYIKLHLLNFFNNSSVKLDIFVTVW